VCIPYSFKEGDAQGSQHLDPAQVFATPSSVASPTSSSATPRGSPLECSCHLFAAAARTLPRSPILQPTFAVSPTRRLSRPALYETLPDYNLFENDGQCALAGHLPKPLRKQAQIVALDLTLLPFLRRRRQGERPDLRSQAKRALFLLRLRLGVHRAQGAALTRLRSLAVTRKPTMEDVTKELLAQVRKAGIHVRFLVWNRGF